MSILLVGNSKDNVLSPMQISEFDNLSGLTLRWMYFPEMADEIRALRRMVFVEEQELGEFVLDSPLDKHGLHLGLFDRERLVSSISLFLYGGHDPYLKELQIESSGGIYVQFSRRAELKEYRSKKLASLMVAQAVKSVCELFQPEGIFAILMGKHMSLKEMYMKMYGFHDSHSLLLSDGQAEVILLRSPAVMQQLVLNMRNETLRLAKMHNLELPNLAHHIDRYEALSKKYSMEADETNRYLQPLSLEDELPRLSAQARMLFMTQEHIWQKIFKEFPSIHHIIDLGCGPGVYLSSVQKLPEAQGRQFMGMDISEDFITYAQFSHSRITWMPGSVYDTKLADDSQDLVHASFLFIHLLKPYLAIKEIHRILSSGGLFYVTDVNDATFQGPELISKMVAKHAEIYEGNREVMLEMDLLAQKSGFTSWYSLDVIVDNTGSDDRPSLEGNRLRLGKWTMWAMFSFMGQRSEVNKEFSEAESYYLTHQDTISIQIQTRIYKKI